MTARIRTSGMHALPGGHRAVTGQGSSQVRPERWVLAARLSRVSKKERELARSGGVIIDGIYTQDQKGAEWAASEGKEIVHVTRDRNISGAMPPWERPELGPWLTDPAKIVQYDGIVAYEIGRLSREYYDVGWLRKWAEQNGKKLYVIKERLRWPDGRDGMLWAVEAERAYQERKDLIEKVVRELTALKNAGKLTGRPPFGYTSDGAKHDRRLVPTDLGRKYIPLIFGYCKQGWSLRKIALWLTAEGVLPPLGGDWTTTTLAKILRNPVYKGHRCEYALVPPDDVQLENEQIVRYLYGGHWVQTARWMYGRTIHRCEPLVGATLWKDANESLSSRPKRGHSDPENQAMLSGALDCPECTDSPMYRLKGGAASKSGREYFYYHCNGRGVQRRSCGNTVTLELVDEAVNEIMERTFRIPVMEKQIIKGNRAELENRLEEIRFELQQLAAARLPWAEEDARRAELRAEYDRVDNAKEIEDEVRLVKTSDTYYDLWDKLPDCDRGAWLTEHGFRVTASKKHVTVAQGSVKAAVLLNAARLHAA